MNNFKNRLMKLGITQQEKKKGERGNYFAEIGISGYFEVLERNMDNELIVNPDLENVRNRF